MHFSRSSVHHLLIRLGFVADLGEWMHEGLIGVETRAGYAGEVTLVLTEHLLIEVQLDDRRLCVKG